MNTKVYKLNSNTSKLELEAALEEITEILDLGEVIAFPTETVYGLGCDIFYENSIKKIFDLKSRNSQKPLAAHISSLDQVNLFCSKPSELFYYLSEKFLPGPLALILNLDRNIPDSITGGLKSISIRYPDDIICLKLIEAYDKPLAATSANISSQLSSINANMVYESFNGLIPVIIDSGTCKYSIESTIIDLTNEENIKVLRWGVIKQEILINSLKEFNPKISIQY